MDILGRFKLGLLPGASGFAGGTGVGSLIGVSCMSISFITGCLSGTPGCFNINIQQRRIVFTKLRQCKLKCSDAIKLTVFQEISKFVLFGGSQSLYEPEKS